MDFLQIGKNGGSPLYVQVRNAILDLITTGKLRVGDQLPGEREIARRMDVSQMTANRAIQSLVDDGYLRRKVGLGTFVVTANPRPVSSNTRINVVLFAGLGLDFVDRDVYLSPLWHGVVEEGTQYGCDFSFLQAVHPGELTTICRALSPSRDRVLLITPPDPFIPEITSVYQDCDVPIVVVGAHWDDSDIAYVDCDNEHGAKLVIDHLVNLGHRHIAILSAWTEHRNTVDRLRGCHQALRCHGLPDRHELHGDVGSGDWDAHTVLRQIEEWFALPPSTRPTAIFALGYPLALAAKQGLEKLGLTVPQHVSLVGFDDSPSAAFFNPPLTTVRQPLAQMGARAVEEVMQGERHRHTLLPVEFVVRRSTHKAFAP